MRRHSFLVRTAVLVGAAVLCVPAFAAGMQRKPSLYLRFETIEKGNLEYARSEGPDRFWKDPLWFRDAPLYANAKKMGIDAVSPNHPLVAHGFKDGQLFYLFYTMLEEAFGGPCLVQRIKRTAKDYSSLEDANPKTTITYKIEVDKTETSLTRHAEFLSLGQLAKREITMEFEVGFLELEHVPEDPGWRHIPERYPKLVHDWDADSRVYRGIRFIHSIKWTLRISFDRDGNYSVTIPQVDMEAPRKLPKLSTAKPYVDPSSRDVVLKDGVGVGRIVLGTSTADDLARELGPPLRAYRGCPGLLHYYHRKGLTFQVHEDDKKTAFRIVTRPCFGGKTAKGIRLGDSKTRVVEVYGHPSRERGGLALVDRTTNQFHYLQTGLTILFDGTDCVREIWVDAAVKFE